MPPVSENRKCATEESSPQFHHNKNAVECEIFEVLAVGVLTWGCDKRELKLFNAISTIATQMCPPKGLVAGVAQHGQRRRTEAPIPKGFVGSNPTPRTRKFSILKREKPYHREPYFAP